ncbi:MAG: diaminopimelate epimerase [bacterium]
MARKIEYSKYHGLENDFVVINQTGLRLRGEYIADFVRACCARQTGIGADGVVLFSLRSGRPQMRLFNADGSEAEISGNGLRILAQHLRRRGLQRERRFKVITKVGALQVRLVSGAGLVQQTEIELARPRFQADLIPMKVQSKHFVQREFKTDAGALVGTAVSVGNPHIVFFVDHFDFDWKTYSAGVTIDKRFPEGVNVEFAVVKTRAQAQHLSWERGVGPTRACATGAAAVAAAGVMVGLLDHQVEINELAGDLQIKASSLDEPLFLTGPSVFIAEGLFHYDLNETHSR